MGASALMPRTDMELERRRSGDMSDTELVMAMAGKLYPSGSGRL